MMSYTVRKFKKILKEGTFEDIINFIDKRDDPYFVYIFRWLHDIESLRLYNEKIGFKNVTTYAHWDILTSCRLEKGRFLIESGLNPHLNSTSGSSLLSSIKDFEFFKYLVEVQGLKIDVKEVIDNVNDIRIIKYVLNHCKGQRNIPKYVERSRSINKTKLLEENGFLFNKESARLFKGEDNVNYLFSKMNSEDLQFEFMKNQAITPYVLRKLFEINKEKTIETFKRDCLFANYKIYILAYELGVMNIFKEEDKPYNFFGNYPNPHQNMSFLKRLPSDVRKKLINERNEENENFLWSGEALRNSKLKDIKYLIENGLEFNFVNNKGVSFLEKARINLDIKQYFIDLGMDKNLKNTATMKTYGQELNILTDYVDYSVKNKIPLCFDILAYFVKFDSNEIKFKSFVQMFTDENLKVKEQFFKKYSLFKDAAIDNKKITKFIISLSEDINKPDTDGVYLPVIFSCENLSLFVEKGFNIDLILNDVDSIKKHLNKYNYEDFIIEAKKIKSQQEKKHLDLIIEKDGKGQKKKRI